MKNDQSIGGTWGVASAALNEVVYSDDTDQAAVTWEGVPEDSQCNATAGQCQCPPAFTIVNDSLLQYLVQNGAEEWAISWDGSLGDGSDKMLFGNAASAPLPVDAPKVPLDFSDGLYRCNVTAIEVDGAIMNQDTGGLPVRRRIPVSLCVAPYKCAKVDNPTKEEVEKVHEVVYGRLRRVYDEQKVYAGYPDRSLHVS